jgi:hypothetical protein
LKCYLGGEHLVENVKYLRDLLFRFFDSYRVRPSCSNPIHPYSSACVKD